MRKMARHFILALLACVTLAACGEKDPPTPPDTGNPSGDIQVSGRERIGWRQLAADANQLGSLQYVIYIDGVRTPLAGATCGTTASAEGFECSAPLPFLAVGRHTLELAAVLSGSAGDVESDRSGPLNVVVTGAARSSSSPLSVSMRTVDGVSLELVRIADGLRDPSDLAFDEDGNILVAERGGMVRVIGNGSLRADAALDLTGDIASSRGGLLAIALDPEFGESGYLYVLYAVDAPRNGLEFMLARFRGVDHRFAERAVLLDRVAASPDGASGALRVGPDRKLYVALDNAAQTDASTSFSSYNGKVLRLNVDATTPRDDRTAFSPIFSFDHPEPKALAWEPRSGDLWVIDSVAPSAGRLRRAASRVGYTLPEGTGAMAAAFYRGSLMPAFQGNLFIAAETSRHLMRLQFDPQDPTRVAKRETLLQDEIGPVRVVAEGRDGALYIANDTALYRLSPE